MPAAIPGTKFKFIFDTDTYHPLNSSPAGESQFQNPADGLYYARSWENMAVDKMVIYLKCHSVEMSGALRSRGAQGKSRNRTHRPRRFDLSVRRQGEAVVRPGLGQKF